MTNDLRLIDTIVQNAKNKIESINDAYDVIIYEGTVKMKRGLYEFSILPIEFITREFTSVSSLPDIQVDIFCCYTLDTNEVRSDKWIPFLNIVDRVRNDLLIKENIPSPLSTVKVDVTFNDDLLDAQSSHRVINCILSLFYEKYALNA